jgi:glucosamine kinase
MINALGLDLGASGIRAYLPGSTQPVAQISAGATAGNREQDTISLIRDLAVAAKNLEVESVCLGMSGFSSLGVQGPVIAQALHETFKAALVFVTSDMVTSHFSHFDEQDGVIVVVGTGSLAFGLGANDHARVDGLGAMLGDFGSAHWIGHQGLRMAKRKAELAGEYLLLEALEEHIGPSSTWPRILARGQLSTFEIAALSKTVAQLSEEGDVTAQEILQEAGTLAAQSAISCAKKVNVSQVAFGGSVLKNTESVASRSFLAALRGANLHSEAMLQSPGVGALAIASNRESERINYLFAQDLLLQKRYDD